MSLTNQTLTLTLPLEQEILDLENKIQILQNQIRNLRKEIQTILAQEILDALFNNDYAPEER